MTSRPGCRSGCRWRPRARAPSRRCTCRPGSARLAAGEVGVSMMTQIRGCSNAKAKAELGWQPIWPTWRDGFRHGLDRAYRRTAAGRRLMSGRNARGHPAALTRRHRGAGQPTPGADAAAVYADLRPLMFSIAYRMLGSVTEAEDIVQEAFLRYHRVVAENGPPDSPKAYLSAVTTRLCIDQLRSARARRAVLRRRLAARAAADRAGAAHRARGRTRPSWPSRPTRCRWRSCCCWSGVSPVERAVFLLHDVFSYGYDETARIVGRARRTAGSSPHRARQHVEEQQAAVRGLAEHRATSWRRGSSPPSATATWTAWSACWPRTSSVYGDSAGTRPVVAAADRRAPTTWAGCSPALGQQARAAARRCDPVEVNGQPGRWSWRARRQPDQRVRRSTSPTAGCRRSAPSSAATSSATSGRWPT